LPGALQRIKEQAVIGMHAIFKQQAHHAVQVLLTFANSSNIDFKLTAYRALKDFILLNVSGLNADHQGIISAFVAGSTSQSEQVQLECASAISFLIAHNLAFDNSSEEHVGTGILDALMLLTESTSSDVRQRAFSTLSTLSTYATQNALVMAQIQQALKLPEGV
jgi:hypothetical protein